MTMNDHLRPNERQFVSLIGLCIQLEHKPWADFCDEPAECEICDMIGRLREGLCRGRRKVVALEIDRLYCQQQLQTCIREGEN